MAELVRRSPCTPVQVAWARLGPPPPAPFLQCKSHLTPDGSGVLANPARIDEEFRKAWLPYFWSSGQRDTSLEEFSEQVGEWLPLLPEVALPRLTGQMLADVVRRKGATAGSLEGWGWTQQHHHNNNTTHNNNNTIWRGSVLTGEEPPLHSGQLNHALRAEQNRIPSNPEKKKKKKKTKKTKENEIKK